MGLFILEKFTKNLYRQLKDFVIWLRENSLSLVLREESAAAK